MNKKLAVIIVNFNGSKDTLDCIESIKKNCTILDQIEIIVVDNNSKEKEKNILIENLKMEKLILNSQNSGFAIANNIGIEYAIKNKFENILLLNNDTIIEKNSFEIMLDTLNSNKDIGAVSCSILYEKEREKIWFDGGIINWNRYMSIHINQGMIYNNETEIVDTEFISGCCMMLKKEVIEKVGMLPTEYFMYFEDTDFSVQILKKGYKMKIAKEAIIYHKVSASSGGEESNFSVEWGARNRIIFMRKYKKQNKSKKQYFIAKSFFFSTRGIKIIKYGLKGDTKKIKSLIRGLRRGIYYKSIK